MKVLSLISIFFALVIAIEAESAEKKEESAQMETKEESAPVPVDTVPVDAAPVPVQIERRFWQNAFDRVHNFHCPSGHSVRRIKSEHKNSYEDRRWMWSCQDDGAIPSSTHNYWSDYVNQFDRDVSCRCKSGYVITGTYSYHKNSYEDRRFKYRCSRIEEDSCKLTGCHETEYLNSFDKPMNFEVPEKAELVGLWSEHSNYYEDRRWMATICNIECEAPTYSINHVEWDTSGISFAMKPQAVASQTVDNPTNAQAEAKLEFTDKKTISETTSWTHSFEAGVKWSAGVEVGIASASTEVHLSYGFTRGRESSMTTEKSFTKTFTTTVPAHTRVKVELVAKKLDNAVIPFTATLKRVLNGKTTVVKKTGTWKGVLFSDDSFKVVPLGKA